MGFIYDRSEKCDRCGAIDKFEVFCKEGEISKYMTCIICRHDQLIPVKIQQSLTCDYCLTTDNYIFDEEGNLINSSCTYCGYSFT